jgi:hypothetical protein
MQRIGAVCTVRAVATLVVGGLTLVAYLWYLTPGPEQIK